MSDKYSIKGGNKEAYCGLATAGQPQDLRVASDLFIEVKHTGGRTMTDTVEYDIANEPLVISKETMDRILKESKNPADCIALYSFYYYTAKWQKTNIAKATVKYCAEGLGIGEDRVRRTKKQLIELGLIADFKRVDSKSGKVLGWYVLVKFVRFKIHPDQIPECGCGQMVEESQTNALSTSKVNALSTNSENARASEQAPKQSKPRDAIASALDDMNTARRAAFELWLQHKKERGQSYKPTGFATLVKKWASATDGELMRAVEFSIMQNYSGIFAEEKKKPGQKDRIAPDMY